MIRRLFYIKSMRWSAKILLIALLYCLKAGIQQVGIILHHDRIFPSGVLTEYITKLNEPKCQCVSEINILYSDQGNYQLLKLKQLGSSSAIPLNFDFKPSNESVGKLRLAKDSTADLFFIGAYNSPNENCQKIKDSLAFAQDHLTAGLIPLVGQIESASVITVDNGQKNLERQFGYAHVPQLKHYQIVENIRLISRHILQLGQSSIREVKLMANHTPICQEIFLNFLQAHFYPELRSRTKEFDHKLEPINFMRTNMAKTNCIKQFIDILGYCPLFYQKKFFNKQIWRNPNFQQVIQLKKVALNAQILYSTGARRLFPKEQSIMEEQIRSQVLYSSENLIISILQMTVIIMLLLSMVLWFKIKALSTNSTRQSTPQNQNKR